MTVSPALVGEALNVAGSIGQGVTDVAVAYSDPKGTRRNRRQLADLTRREALGLLGLTPEEQALAQQRTQGAARSAFESAQADAARRSLAQPGDVSALAGQDAALQALGEVQTNIGAALTEADIAAREQQRQEIEQRQSFDAQVRANRARAVGNLLTGGVLAGAGAAQTATALGTGGTSGSMPQDSGSGAGDGTDIEVDIETEFQRPQSMKQDAALRELGYDVYGMSSY